MAETESSNTPSSPGSAPQQPPEQPGKPSAASAAAAASKKTLQNLKSLGLWAQLGEIFKDLADPDPRTRRMARFFLASVVGLVVVAGIGISSLSSRHGGVHAVFRAGDQGGNLGDFIKKQSDQTRRRLTSQALGTFSIELKSPSGAQADHAPRLSTTMGMAQVDIVVECDEPKTCEFVEDRMPEIRDVVTSLFTSMDREELLSREGKHRLRQRIIDKLNLWMPQGKIQEVYFDKLIIS